MTDILFVTLARGGSKGVPGKHTRLLGGKPVIAWTLEAVKALNYATQYVVSSDDIEILNIAKQYGTTPMLRPEHLARDDTPTLPALQHAVKKHEQMTGMTFKYIIEVRATSPFKTANDIDWAVRKLVNSDADSVIGVTALDDHHPMRAKWLNDDGYIQDFIAEPHSGRRQDCLPKAYIRNGTIYALRVPVTMLFGHAKSIGYVMPGERSINLDTEMDWLLCKAMIERNGK